MKYATVCSGIEAPSLAWHGLGWSPVWFSEIENFPAAVLANHYPTVPNLGDMTMLHENETYKNQSIDLLCGGTPCQSFSFAGLRKGLDDERGNLALHFIRILGEKRPTWFVWENVPGVLSSAGGRDFATILGGFTGRHIAIPRNGWGNAGIVEGIPDAYGIAWATLDAQYFGVPQRRRRIFIVGHLGDWHSPAAVLFDTACLSGHPAPRRETREGIADRIAPCIGSGGKAAGSVTQQDAENGALLYGLDAEMNPFQDGQMGPLLKGSPTGGGTSPIVYRRQNQKDGIVQDVVTAPLLANGTTTDERSVPLVLAHGQANAEIVSDGSPSLTCNHEAPILFGRPGNWIGRKPENGGNQTEPFHDQSPCLTKTDKHAVAFGWQNSERQGDSSGEICPTLDKSKTPAVCFAQNSRDELREMSVSGALAANPGMKQTSYIRDSQVVRRFTPTECERLQGMPDNYTRIPYRNAKPENCPDGPRYRAIGNSMAVPVMRWIGGRIDFINSKIVS
jgi:DNA (cytosine-5)-methyltransferase 1